MKQKRRDVSARPLAKKARPAKAQPAKAQPANAEGRWTEQEKKQFRDAVKRHGWGNWTKIAPHIPSREYKQVKSHAQKVLTHNPEAKKWVAAQKKAGRGQSRATNAKQSKRDASSESESGDIDPGAEVLQPKQKKKKTFTDRLAEWKAASSAFGSIAPVPTIQPLLFQSHPFPPVAQQLAATTGLGSVVASSVVNASALLAVNSLALLQQQQQLNLILQQQQQQMLLNQMPMGYGNVQQVGGMGMPQAPQGHYQSPQAPCEDVTGAPKPKADPNYVRPDLALQQFLSQFDEKGQEARERLLGAIKDTEGSLATIHEWDRSQGLRKCHSRTVVKTRRSRGRLKAFLMGVDPPKEPVKKN